MAGAFFYWEYTQTILNHFNISKKSLVDNHQSDIALVVKLIQHIIVIISMHFQSILYTRCFTILDILRREVKIKFIE